MAKFMLQRIRLDSGGYANRGRHYFGVGMPLYWYMQEDENATEDYIRARNRDHAKEIIREKYPKATFYR